MDGTLTGGAAPEVPAASVASGASADGAARRLDFETDAAHAGVGSSDAPAQQPADQLLWLQQRKHEYLLWFKQAITQQASLQPGPDGTLDASVLVSLGQHAATPTSQLLSNLYRSGMAYGYLQLLTYWVDSVRELERKQAALQEYPPVSDPTFDLVGYTAVAHEAIQALAHAIHTRTNSNSYASTVSDIPPVVQAAETIDGRMQQCRYNVYTRLTSDAGTLLERLHWPPPLVQSKQQAPAPAPYANGLAAGASAAQHPQANGDMHAPPIGAGDPAAAHGEGAGAQGGEAVFSGFDSDQGVYAQLLAVLSCLTVLQQTVDTAAFAEQSTQAHGTDGAAQQQDSQQRDLPVLWAAQCLTAPLQARLQTQFQPHTEAGRLDATDWLFKLTMRLLKHNAAYMTALQPALDSAGLQGRAQMVMEWARAVRDMTKAVLRTTKLPALLEAWDQCQTDSEQDAIAALWARQVDAIQAFDTQIAPYLGSPQQLAQSSLTSLPDALLPDSVLGCITEDEPFFNCWMHTLEHQALKQFNTAADTDHAWQAAGAHPFPPAPPSANGPPSFLAAFPQGLSLSQDREFKVPGLAEQVLDSVTHLVHMSARMPTANTQRALLDRVGSAVLTRLREVLRSTFNQIHHSTEGVVSQEGAPRAGACAAIARYVHCKVSELLTGESLHRLHRSTHATHGDASASQQTSLPTLLSHTSPGLLGEVVVRHGFTPVAWDPPVLSLAVADLGSFHREMCLRMAQELSITFGKEAGKYLAEVQQEGRYPTHTGAADTALQSVSRLTAQLQAGLAHLYLSLDEPSFRDIWRAVAVPINRFLFNHIATEVQFTQAGAAQFRFDCMCIADCFRPYTKKPKAHFREVFASIELLTMSDEDAQQVVQWASQAEAHRIPLHKDPRLVERGLSVLLPAQIVAVVNSRI